jgi:thioredoxin reductase (NADPH)
MGFTVEELKGETELTGILIRNVKTDKLTEIHVDGIFIAIGVEPNTELVEGKIQLDDGKYIITDDKMQTNIPGVFAAGDIRNKVLRQIVTSAADGAVAAYMAEMYISNNS